MGIFCCVFHFPASSSLFMHLISLLLSSLFILLSSFPKMFCQYVAYTIINICGRWAEILVLETFFFFFFTCSIVSSSSLLSSSICFFLLSKALMSLSNFITFPSFMSISFRRFWKCIQVKILHNVHHCYMYFLCRRKVVVLRVTVGLSAFSYR